MNAKGHPANLVTLSPNEARKQGRKGGIASGKIRREKKDFRALLQELLDLPLTELDNLAPRVAIALAMISKAAGGDKAAADWVRDTAGEKPSDKMEITETPPPLKVQVVYVSPNGQSSDTEASTDAKSALPTTATEKKKTPRKKAAVKA